MKVYIPLKLGRSIPMEVLHAIHEDYDVIINEKAADEKKYISQNIADNKLECIKMGISSGDEFFGMMDADIIIKKAGIFNELANALRALPGWGALSINTHPGKFIDHVCSRVMVFRSEAAKVITMADIQKYQIEDICIAVEMRQAGWNLGYYRLNQTGYVENLRVAA